MKVLSAVVACLAVLCISGCAGRGGGLVAAPPVAATATMPIDPSLPANVVALAPDQLARSEFAADADHLPTSAEIRAVIPLVRARFETIELSTTLQPFGAYHLQFAGLRGGRTAVNALCSVDRMSWRSAWITVNDGGDCYWQAVVRDGRVESFSRNGSA